MELCKDHLSILERYVNLFQEMDSKTLSLKIVGDYYRYMAMPSLDDNRDRTGKRFFNFKYENRYISFAPYIQNP